MADDTDEDGSVGEARASMPEPAPEPDPEPAPEPAPEPSRSRSEKRRRAAQEAPEPAPEPEEDAQPQEEPEGDSGAPAAPPIPDALKAQNQVTWGNILHYLLGANGPAAAAGIEGTDARVKWSEENPDVLNAWAEAWRAEDPTYPIPSVERVTKSIPLLLARIAKSGKKLD